MNTVHKDTIMEIKADLAETRVVIGDVVSGKFGCDTQTRNNILKDLVDNLTETIAKTNQLFIENRGVKWPRNT